VVSGSNDVHVQVVINAINDILQNIGRTIDLKSPVYFRQGNDEEMQAFVEDLAAGSIDGVVFMNCNPVYDHYHGAKVEAALSEVNLKVSLSDREDETAAVCDYLAPTHHYLESWDDAQPVSGHYSLCQPVISPLFDTRQHQESLLTWAAAPNSSYYDFVRDYWKGMIFPTQNKQTDFQTFFDQCLHDGMFITEMRPVTLEEEVFSGDLMEASSAIASTYRANSKGIELACYETIALGDGSQANNPWLQETPDPITKACWDNYLTIPQAMANELGIKMVEGKTMNVKLKTGELELTLPAIVQPGQTRNTVGLALGYGRSKAGRVANGVGKNAYPLLGETNGLPSLSRVDDVVVEVTQEPAKVAHTQTHHTFMNREYVVQETTLNTFVHHPEHAFHRPKIAVSAMLEKKLGDDEKDLDGKVPPREISMWKGHSYNNHHWAMTVDLNSCIGCSACSVACQAENNVPVVGKEGSAKPS
jgi:anaerobic selenocysteine-containing dehydrogenase/NAD-dependent dihydropyrimidine dehydrogenase PreA subunit